MLDLRWAGKGPTHPDQGDREITKARIVIAGRHEPLETAEAVR